MSGRGLGRGRSGYGSRPSQPQPATVAFTFGGSAPIKVSNPFSPVGTAPSSTTTNTSNNELQDTDFATLSSLLVPTLPPGHPALIFLEETPRRNFTTKIRTLFQSIIVQHQDCGDDLTQLRKLFEVIRTIFNSESDEGMKLQLNQPIDPSKVGLANDIKNTFLGLILYCLNRYPWLSQSVRVDSSKTTKSQAHGFGLGPEPQSNPALKPRSGDPFQPRQMGSSLWGLGPPNPLPSPTNHGSEPAATSSKDTMNSAAASGGPRAQLVWTDVGDEIIGLGRIILGLQQNLLKHGYTTSSSNLPILNSSAHLFQSPLTDAAIGEVYMSNILSLCILQFHRQPLIALIQPMVDLFQILIKTQSTPSPPLSLPSASSISLTAIPDASTMIVGGSSAELDEAFLRLFQQNPQMTKELLPFIRLFKQSGIKPRQITSSTHLLKHDSTDDRRLNIWIYFTFWLTLEKVEFLIRWLLEESNLSEIYDPNYRLDFGDGHGSQTILAYITRIKSQQPNRAPVQLYHQLLTHLSTVSGGSSVAPHAGGVGGVGPSDEELASSLAELSTSSSTSSSSVVSAKGDHRSSVCDRTNNHSYLVQSQVRVCDESSFRSWLEDALDHITSPRSYISARLLERLTAPLRLTASSPRFGTGHKPSGPELTPLHQTNLHEAVSELIVVLREQPTSLNLLEEDVYGNILFHSILALPTNELIRLKIVEATLFKLIDSLPPTIMSDFRRVLDSQSHTVVNEVYDEIVLFHDHQTPQLSGLTNFIGGHRIYPIFNEGTIRLEVTGMQFWHAPARSGTTTAPTLELWDCASKTILGTADVSRTPLINNAMNIVEFDPPIILTEEQAQSGVLGSIYLSSGQLGYINVSAASTALNPHPDYRIDVDALYSNSVASGIYPTANQDALYYYLVAPVIRRVSAPIGQILQPKSTNASSASNSPPASFPNNFLSVYKKPKQDSCGLGYAPDLEVGTVVEFDTPGYLYGLRIFEEAINDGRAKTGFTELKVWNGGNFNKLTAKVRVRIDPAKPWSIGWLEPPVQVRAGERLVISYTVDQVDRMFTLAPRHTQIHQEFRFSGGRSGPSGTMPTIQCEASTIDVLFSTTRPKAKVTTKKSPATNQPNFSFKIPTTPTATANVPTESSTTSLTTTESPTPFSFSLDSAFTMGSTVNPFTTKVESKENNETTSATSSSSSIGTELSVPNFIFTAPTKKKDYSRLTADVLYGSATPSQQMNDSGLVIHIIGNSTSTPLDLLFTHHSPYPQGEFIYQLFERLLNKAIPNNLTPLELRELVDNGTVGNFHRILNRRSQMEINELRVWLDLLQRHSIHSTDVKLKSTTSGDIFEPWIRSGDLGRIREWFMENHSTDALWPTRTGLGVSPQQSQESLYETAKRLSEDATFISQGQNGVNVKAMVKYLETQRDRWYDLYLPLIRINITEQLIPDLAEIVCDYLIPSKYPKPVVPDTSFLTAAASSSSVTAASDTPNKRVRTTTASTRIQPARREPNTYIYTFPEMDSPTESPQPLTMHAGTKRKGRRMSR